MLERFLGDSAQSPIGWEELGHGAPTVIALARVASQAYVSAPVDLESWGEFSVEAKTILYAARQRGVLAIRGSNQAFDSVNRFLHVFVETQPDTFLRFGSRESPQQTLRFLDGFRDLCATGLVMHHLYYEFSLTTRGFEVAESIDPAEVQACLRLGVDPTQAEY